MTAKVEDRVALWLSSHPGSTLVEIARGVRAKDETVRDVLGGPLFTFSLSGKSYRYWLRGSRQTSRDEVRRDGKPETHKQKVLRLLADGEWHTHHEGYALHVMLHSRVSDLRDDGYQIECDKSSRPYRYRMLLDVEGLVGETGDPATFPVRRSTVPTTGPSTSSSPVTAGEAGEPPTTGAALPDSDGQLTLVGGAFTKQRRAA